MRKELPTEIESRINGRWLRKRSAARYRPANDARRNCTKSEVFAGKCFAFEK
jgi:hypothetical protein